MKFIVSAFVLASVLVFASISSEKTAEAYPGSVCYAQSNCFSNEVCLVSAPGNAGICVVVKK